MTYDPSLPLQLRIPAIFMRGGTSKGVFFLADDLPADLVERDRILLRVIGSPDPYGKQIDGMGGATSSTSKVVVVSRSQRADSDVDYLFGAVSVDRSVIDWSGNCGNLSAAVGPFAIHRGLVAASPNGMTTVRIWQLNIRRRILAQVPMVDGQVQETGHFMLDGVAFPAAEIPLSFVDPAGGGAELDNGALFPTGLQQQSLVVPSVGEIAVSFINAGNPTIFIHAADLGLKGTELPAEVNANAEVLQRAEAIPRCRCGGDGTCPNQRGCHGEPSPHTQTDVARRACRICCQRRAGCRGYRHSADCAYFLYGAVAPRHDRYGRSGPGRGRRDSRHAGPCHHAATPGRGTGFRPPFRNAQGCCRSQPSRWILARGSDPDEPYGTHPDGGLGQGAQGLRPLPCSGTLLLELADFGQCLGKQGFGPLSASRFSQANVLDSTCPGFGGGHGRLLAVRGLGRYFELRLQTFDPAFGRRQGRLNLAALRQSLAQGRLGFLGLLPQLAFAFLAIGQFA